MARSASKRSEAEITYEQALAELENIVQKLESGQLPLEDSISLFEQGQKLLARCGSLLKQAQLRVRTLSGSDDPSDEVGE